MAAVDGGRNAARGYFYQYMRTVEALLVALSDDRIHACRIEGDPAPDQVKAADFVDFDLVDKDGRIVQAAQVKSGGETAELSVGDVFKIFFGLVDRVDAEEYRLLTNTGLSANAVELSMLLARDEPLAQRAAALRTVLRRSSALQIATNLTNEHLERLGRCRIGVDRRDRSELNDALRHAVHDARRQGNRGLGAESSGLLLRSTQSEIHARAGSAADAVWTMDEFRKTLAIPDDELVRALGERDWGGALGPMPVVPDIKRSALLVELAEHLNPYRSAPRRVGICVLTGLSGIGKSSLAASYFADYADAYDAVFWVDASTPAAVVHGFRSLARHLGANPSGAEAELRADVHERLSTFPGRWLIVFDDANSTEITTWIPKVGDGDVVITSIDSLYRITGAAAVSVPSMGADEAIQLLKNRLELPAPAGADDMALLAKLAEEMEHWPLAMELATGYMRTCDYSVDDIPRYIETLKLRSFADRYSKPVGYPRTLVGAVNLVVEKLQFLQPRSVARLAVGMLAHAVYLGARQIPVHLLAAAQVKDLDTTPSTSGPVILDQPEVLEAVRLLRRVSFAHPDQALPKGRADMPTADRTINVNTVLQEVLRARIEVPSNARTYREQLGRLAFHLEIWVSSALHNGEADKAEALLLHAAVMVGHLHRLGVAGNKVALLIGNLAGLYLGRGEIRSAIDLLRTEIQMLLAEDAPNEVVLYQARLILANALTEEGHLDGNTSAEAVSHLESVFAYAQALALETETHAAAATFCRHSIDVLDRIEQAGHEQKRTHQLAIVFREFRDRLPATEIDDVWDTCSRAEALIMNDEYAAAELLCRRAIDVEIYGTNVAQEARRLFAEALALQAKWPETRAALDELAVRIGNTPMYVTTATKAFYNVAMPVALHVLGGGSNAVVDLMEHILNLPCFSSMRSGPDSEYRAKYHILRLLAEAKTNSFDDVVAHLPLARNFTSSETTIVDDEVWSWFAQEVCQMAQERVNGRH